MAFRAKAKLAAVAVLLLLTVGLAGVGIALAAGGNDGAEGKDMAMEDASPYVRWANGPPTDSAFFPLGVWAQTPGGASTVRRYREAHINVYVGGWDFTKEWVENMRRENMGVICSLGDYSGQNLDEKVFWGWMSAHEPDNARPLKEYWNDDIEQLKREWPQLKDTTIRWAVPVPPLRVQKKHEEVKAKDPSRPTFLILGRSVAVENWHGRGHRTGHLEDYPHYVKGGDIISYDVYPAVATEKEIHGKLWYVAKGLLRMQKWARNGQVTWNFIEATNQTPGPNGTPDPATVKSEVWISIIHGSRGIIYFVHQFQPRFIEASVLADPNMARGFAALNKEVISLAPVINSPTVADGVSVKCSVPGSAELTEAGLKPLAAMAKRHQGAAYVFAVRMEGSPARGTFTVKGVPATATVTVLGEDRTLTAKNGTFTDDFAAYAVHLYKIPLQA